MGRARINLAIDGFAAVFGTRRGLAESEVTSPQVVDVHALMAIGDITTAARLTARLRLHDAALTRSLAAALADEALETRWSSRALGLLAMCGAIPLDAPHLLRDRERNLIHIWPTGVGRGANRFFGYAPKTERTVCGRSVNHRENLFSHAERGSWLAPQIGQTQGVWLRCAQCEPAAADYADTKETAQRPPLFTEDAFVGTRALLTAIIRDAISSDPANASRKYAQTAAARATLIAPHLVHDVALAAAAGGREGWEVALRVRPDNPSTSYGLTPRHIEYALGLDFDPSAWLLASDWEQALNARPLAQWRMTSDKHRGEFARALWHTTLDRVKGPEREHDGTVFYRSR
jgi:hypothetical protein